MAKKRRTKEQIATDKMLRVPKFLQRKASKKKIIEEKEVLVSKWDVPTAKNEEYQTDFDKGVAQWLETQKKNKKVKLSPQQHMKNQVGELIGELEEKIDDHINSGLKKHDFKMYEWLRMRGIKGPQTLMIIEYYKPQVDELADVCNQDEEVQEGYSWMSKRQFGNHLEMMQDLMSDAEKWLANVKVGRKVRARKPLSSDKQVKSLKFMKEHPKFKIVSVEPSSIVGASQLWVFNTSTRQLGVYDAVDRGGFGVKGSTLKGWAEPAFMKKIRKPEELLPKVLTGGKVALRKLMPDIKAKEVKMTGRINRHCVLLKVVQ